MKEVFVHHDPTIVGFKKSILDAAGIDFFIRNKNTSATFGAGAFGLVQSPVFDPVLCIIDDQRYEEALALLKQPRKSLLRPARIGAVQSVGNQFQEISKYVGAVPHQSLKRDKRI